MKKLILTLAVVLGISLSVNAQYFENGGGLFELGAISDEEYYGAGSFREDGLFGMPDLPIHNQPGNHDAPLGSGLIVLAGLGAAYALKKRRDE